MAFLNYGMALELLAVVKKHGLEVLTRVEFGLLTLRQVREAVLSYRVPSNVSPLWRRAERPLDHEWIRLRGRRRAAASRDDPELATARPRVDRSWRS